MNIKANLVEKDVHMLMYSFKGCNKSCMPILFPSCIHVGGGRARVKEV